MSFVISVFRKSFLIIFGLLVFSIANADDASIETVVVTSTNTKNQQVNLSPKVGATVYTIDTQAIDALSAGSDTPFNEVLLHLPGVDQDSKASGSLHVRDDHGNVQYRIDGVQLPESISGFGQSIDTRFIQTLDFATGALPAQYGLRTAGVVDIQTKQGDSTPGGRMGVLVGSHNTFEPSAELFGGEGAFKYYLSGSYVSNALGIENPLKTANALHDQTQQTKTFGNFSYAVDGQTKIDLLLGTYNGKFQIPDNPSQTPLYSLTGLSNAATGYSALPSSALNENQSEVNRFFVLSFQKNEGDLNYQASFFHQYANLHYTPDVNGDLIYLGTASDTLRSNTANGIQFDIGNKIAKEHTLRAGMAYTRQVTVSNNSVSVFPVDGSGNQTSTNPLTIADNSNQLGTLTSFYAQDEWQISQPLTINYGLRFDHVSAFINEQQLSPRINLAYKATESTAYHAGFSRYFTPPPQELASQSSINLYTNTTAAASVPISSPVKAERSNYFDFGVTQQFNQRWSGTANAYYKKITNLMDEGQFGQAIILSPFNYQTGFAKGLELSSTYTEKHWGGYLNIALEQAMGKNIISGQSLFSPNEIAYIANHYIYLDHNQTVSMSGGAHYRLGDSQISTDVIYGSGLRNTPLGGTPNSGVLPSYTTVNAAFTHTWHTPDIGNIEGRLAVLNLFNRNYLLRDGTGVGVGAPQYGADRGFFLGLYKNF